MVHLDSVLGRIRPLPCLLLLGLVAIAPAQEPVTRANWQLAEKFSAANLRKFVYSTSVEPNWIGKTDRFWYSFRTSDGTRYWLVDAAAKSKQPLFDHPALATALSISTKKPHHPAQLALQGLQIDDAVTKLQFTASERRFEYELAAGKLTDKGAAPRRPEARGPGGAELSEEMRQRIEQMRRERGDRQERDDEQEREQREQQQQQQDDEQEQQERDGQRDGRDGRGGAQRGSRGSRVLRAISPDGSASVFVREHDLYFIEGQPIEPKPKPADPEKPAEPPATGEQAAAEKGTTDVTQKQADTTGNGAAGAKGAAAEGSGNGATGNGATGSGTAGNTAVGNAVAGNGAAGHGAAAATSNGATATGTPAEASTAPARPRFRFDDEAATRLTQDSVEKYSFAPAPRQQGGRGGGRTPTAGRLSATWSKDSKALFATRRDTRQVPELYLVDSLATPRPTLQQYPYSMPGEPTIAQTELWVFDRGSRQLRRVERKWDDESYVNVHFLGDTSELRFVRRDRLQRNAELCALDPATGAVRVLLSETIEDATLALQNVRYLDKRGQFLWWSERSGWGHFYLHDAKTGALVHEITRGPWRAGALVEVDDEAGVLWFRGNCREPGENLYHEHLYRVDLDGTDLTCLDPGDALHRSRLSPSRRFVVDNYSRVDLAPVAILRDGKDGSPLLELERADLRKLEEMGWRMPERFTVKAADGVTDLFGNSWRPFDFDPARKYPVIVNVYPGPQQEGVTHSFSATNGNQQLAQLGFLVVQVGHRGGTPARDKAYGAFGFGNLRDYGLEDKKVALEQLADRHPYFDLSRVGIYGHSGGGFMTAAALLKEPYNRFFKVGVASAGNHDNNIYNANWSERWHGLDPVQEAKAAAVQQSGATAARTGDAERGAQQRTEGESRRDATTQRGQTTRGDATRGGAQRDGERTQDGPPRKFEIEVPTNAELAPHLEGKLLLVHGEIDNNVHPANTMRLVDALIRANKRFDMLIIPGARHSFGHAQDYFRHRMFEYFAEHLLGDRPQGADLLRK